ncbi:Hypothetical predicted protein [Paramuricea clavata]|uniref:Uncharacterized protein n=1 Tax=Paramuricea clavata TaxID=317549 RepID=A0A6S7HL80_PARCT|nr:Hypothetical predicted protein [Paramuricea clavata]
MEFPAAYTKDNVLQAAIGIFFENGQSKFGFANEMEFDLANFKMEKVDVLRDNDGIENPFTIQGYFQCYKLSKARIYLMSKDKTITEVTNSETEVNATSNDFPAWDDFFDEENQSTMGDSPQISSPIFNEPTSKSQLIGTSEERASFFTELEGKVRRSELADQEKARENERQKREAERREELRLSREARVFPEVEIDDPSHMLVNVRHISFGIVTRSFKKEWSVSAVYDWIGSLSAQPEHFSLTCAITKKLIFPDVKCETVQRTTLNMSEREIPVPLSEDEKEVFFYAGNSSHFEVTDDTVVTNTNSFELEQVSSIPPQQLLSGDENDSSQSYDAEMSTYGKLQDIRQTELDKMHETCIALIDKNQIVEEVLKLYEDEALIRKRLSVSFVDAVATGSGPQREMFSLFWNSFLSENGIGYSQFTFRVHPHFPLERYPILG